MNKMEKFVNGSIFPWFGTLGSVITSIGCIIAAIAYQGPTGQRYSMGNYFISELGGASESELAIAFNLGTLVGGLIMTVFMLGCLFYFSSRIGKVGSFIGIFAGIMGALVGVYPYDVNIALHGLTAMGFFYGCMIAVILLTIGLFFEKVHPYPLYLKFLGILAGVFFLIFNFALGDFAAIFTGSPEVMEMENFSLDTFRPPGIWMMALFEWLSLIGMLVWIFAASLHMQKLAHFNAK